MYEDRLQNFLSLNTKIALLIKIILLLQSYMFCKIPVKIVAILDAVVW